MKKILSLVLLLFLALLMSSCGIVEAKLTNEMIDSKYFSAKKTSSKEFICHLTINDDKTYEYYYESFIEENDSINLNGTWEHVISFKYTYIFYYDVTRIKQKNNGQLAVYKLNGLVDENDKQCYFVYGVFPYELFFTNEEITKSFLESYRVDAKYSDEGSKDGYIDLPGIELIKKGSVGAEWQ